MKIKKLLALFLALAMALSLAACGSSSSSTSSTGGDTTEVEPGPVETEAPDTTEVEPGPVETETPDTTEVEPGPVVSTNDTLVFGEDQGIGGKFNWLFYDASTDDDVCALIFDTLLTGDRTAAVIEHGIEGETVAYNGTDYTYYGIGDVEVEDNSDTTGEVIYNFTMRDDIYYSNGTHATIDDFIFALYVTLDPTYDGIMTYNSMAIKGLDEYLNNMDSLFNLLVAAGEDNTDFSLWDEDTQVAFWADLKQAGEQFAQEIVDYCAAAGYADGPDDVATAAAAWGFGGLSDDATAADFFDMLCVEYDWDLATMSSVETAGTSLYDFMEDYDAYSVGISTGESADYVSGIEKTGDYSFSITMTEVDCTALLNFAGIPLLSVEYYGDLEFDADAHCFGFTKGDLSYVKSKTTSPMGSGPYKFISFENGTVMLEKNETYWKGEPKISYINIVEMADADKIPALQTGTADIVVPSYNSSAVDQISSINSNGEVSGDIITTYTVYNNGYGYIGINADAVCVGGDGGSEASKNLRKAFATLFAVYRDEVISSYYGELATVINYPISSTSWAAPQTTDEGYQIAFSVDVNGDPIYTDSMTTDEKYAAALEAALGFFEAAGYTVEDGVITAAPEGAKLEYSFIVPGGGTGDHPNYQIALNARDALESIGITLTIDDTSEGTSYISTRLESGVAEMWTMAWGGSTDPDMYQIYYSGIESGAVAGGSNYTYDIRDAELDELILAGRTSFDTTFRKTIYKAALDIVVDWASEVPVYQRLNAYCISTERVNLDTVTPDITTFWGALNDIELLEMN